MERPRGSEFRAVLDLLETLYQPTDLQDFKTHVISSLLKVVPCDGSAYTKVNPRTRQIDYVTKPSIDARLVEPFQKHLHEHPLINHYARTGDGRALQLSDFLTRSQLHRLGLYNEFGRLIGIEEQIAITLPGLPHIVVGFTLSRSRGPFTERERLILNLLRPHLTQAYQNAEMLTRLMQMASLPDGGWESSRRGLLIVTEALRVRLATSNARQILSRYFERPLHSTSPDALPETLNRWLRYHERIRKEASEPYDPRQPFVVHRAKRSLIVRLLTQGRESVLLLEERETAAASASLKSLGLSRREAEILTYTARGKTNREIGALIGVSHRTVAKHLEHIFTKLGVRTRTAAVVRALSRLGQDDLTAPALGELSTLTERRDRAAGA